MEGSWVLSAGCTWVQTLCDLALQAQCLGMSLPLPLVPQPASRKPQLLLSVQAALLLSDNSWSNQLLCLQLHLLEPRTVPGT